VDASANRRGVDCRPGAYPTIRSRANSSEIAGAIGFVHGFNGVAASTWTDFLSLVVDDNAARGWWRNAGLYFMR
jgi:hypothetical protein